MQPCFRLRSISDRRGRPGVRLRLRPAFVLVALAFLIAPLAGLAAEGAGHGDAAALSPVWIAPFALLLLAIAIVPMINAHFWEKHLWWIALGVFAAPMAVALLFFLGDALRHMFFEKILEYASFILLLAALFIISGGILIEGRINGTPAVNATILFIGSVIANFIGTTGASMLLIRPILRANKSRPRSAHVVVFFIFLVSNIGGVLTPLGDPPLFLGYLQGVPFEWTFRLFPQWALATALVLTIFYIFDTIIYRKDSYLFGAETPLHTELDVLRSEVHDRMDQLDTEHLRARGSVPLSLVVRTRGTLERVSVALDRLADEGASRGLRVSGVANFALLGGVILVIYLQGLFSRTVPGWPHFGPQEVAMAALAGASLLLTPRNSRIREANSFNFGPIKEVALLFAGIFATMIPALYILEQRGSELGLTKAWQFFWVTGALSSFLDNAPTYLTFLSTAKGVVADLGLANDLGFTLSDGKYVTQALLAAISCGAVFMGANSYIGNGPNFMVRAIAESEGVKMPSFFGYMVYSGLILLPVFVVLTFVFFL